MRSKKRTIEILIVVIAVLLGFVNAIFLINKHNNPRNEKENISSNIYNEKVDSAIDSVLFSEDYNSLSLDEKKDRMLSILYQLEKDGEILKDSIFYQESEKAIWFQYPDGFEDGVILESSKNGYSGNANIDDYIVRKDEQGRILSYNCDIDFNSNEYPYTAKEVKSLDLKAKFMYGLGYDSILDEYKKYQTIWTKQYLKTDIDDYCTVEDFKSGLFGHDIIFIEEHGLLKIKTPLICTTEEFIKGKYNDDKANLLFPKSDNGKRYYYIKPSFFKKYYEDEKLKGAIVWIGSCHGYQCDDLVNVFSHCGAKAVIGYDESVLTGYDCVMLNPFVYSLLYGDSVSEALNFAKSVFGQNDLEYWTTYNGTKSKFGTIALMPPGKTNCATAKLYPGSENARLIDVEIIGAQRGGEIKSKTQSTEPVEIKELNYKWHLEPTIEAEDIIVSDVEKISYYGFNANPFDEYSIVNENGKYRFIKYDGTYISDNQYDQWYFSKPDTLTLSSENGEISILGYDDNKIIYQSDAAGWGRQGFYIDNKTKEIYATEYNSASRYNESNNVVIQSADVSIMSDEENSSTLELNNVGKYGIANSNGPVVDCIYDDACMNIGSNIIALEKNGKWGYFNKDGTQIIDFVCEPFESKILDVMWFHTHNDENIQHPYLNSYGYIPVKINGQFGYYDTQGNEIIPCGTFEEVRPVHNGFAWVKKDGKWGVIQLENIEQETESTTTDEQTNTDVVIDIYEGETITLSGTIFYEHYEINSNNSGDALILELDEPFTAKYCKSEAFEIGSTEKITSVQISSDDMSKFSEGQHITITGTIMNAHTGHHVRSIILLTDDANNNISGQQTSSISDNQILKAVNQYLEENQNHLGVFLSNSDAYCPAEYVASRDTSWSCPINDNNYTYSSGYIAGSYPYYVFADKETMICTISANYETVAEFDLTDYIN